MRVLFIDTVHPILWKKLEAAGHECKEAYSLTREHIECEIGAYHGIVIRSKFTIDENFLKKASQLKFIARSGSGLENIDLETTKERGVKVYNSPEGNRDAVGEHALGMLLMLLNHLKRGDTEVRKQIWRREENRGLEIGGKTIGLIGFGNTGRAFAQKLSGFDCRVLAYDKYHPDTAGTNAMAATPETIAKEADILSFHLPLTPETEYLFDLAYIGRMAKPFYLINTSRGRVVNTADLVEGMKTGQVLGACLDVLEYESKAFNLAESKETPEAFQFLIESENVVLSPHVAGWTRESYIKLSSVLADKILAEF